MKNLTTLFTFLFFSFASAQTSLLPQNAKMQNGFVENKGQVINQHNKQNKKVLYLLSTPGLNVQLRQKGFSYDFYETTETASLAKNLVKHAAPQEDSIQHIFTSKFHRVDFDFENINPGVEIIKEEKSFAHFNYYTTNKDIEHVCKYKKITYRNLYPGIDLVFSVPDDNAKPVEYNFIVHENGNINNIRFKVNGAANDLKSNKIVFSLRFGKSEEIIPQSWIEDKGFKTPLDIRYKKLRKNVYAFECDSKLTGKKVVIDPVPIRLWGTYYGGSASAYPFGITTDAQNNVYVMGQTQSTDYVATEGSFEPEYIDGPDYNGYISMFSTDGVQLWGTYLPVVPQDITADSESYLIASAHTITDIPNITTPGTHQPVKKGSGDCLLLKFDQQGLRIWGTYYGGNSMDTAAGLTVDTNNNIYFVGGTSSSSFIATPGTADTSISGGPDGFLACFTPNGTLSWGTYFGGTNADEFFTVEFSDNYIYAMATVNSGGLGTPGSYQPEWNGTAEISIAKYDMSGGLEWSTYAGGESYDYLLRSAISGNKLFLEGRTASSTNIGTPGSLYPNYIVSNNMANSSYLMCFDTQNQTMIYGTYFPNQVAGVAANSSGNLFFSGETSQATGISTPDAYMPEKGFYHKSFLIKLDDSGQRIWGTYYGGEKAEQLSYVAIDTANDIYMHGKTNGSLTGIATEGAHQLTAGGTYIVKFRDCNSFATLSSNSPVCNGQSIYLNAQGGTNYLWTGPNNFSSAEANPIIPDATTLYSGTYSCSITGTAGCDAVQTIEVTVGDTVAPVADVAELPLLTANCSISITQVPTATDICDGTINAITTDPLAYNVAGNYTIHWNFTDSSGNTTTQQQEVTINAPETTIEPNVGLNQCEGNETFNLTNAQLLITTQSGASFSFYTSLADAMQQINAITNTTAYNYSPNLYELYAVVTFPNGCKALSQISLGFYAKPYLPPLELSICGTVDTLLDLTVVEPQFDFNNDLSVTYYASATDLQNDIPVANPQTFALNGQSQTLYVKAINTEGCTATETLTLTVEQLTEFELPVYEQCAQDSPVVFNLLLNEPDILALLPQDVYTFKYYNQYNEAINESINTINPQVSLASGTATIYIWVKGSSGCPYIVKQPIMVREAADTGIAEEYTICEDTALTLTLPDGFYDYKWSDGSTGQSNTFTQPGSYYATVSTFANGLLCVTTKSFSITQYSKPHISEIQFTDFSANDNSITILPLNSTYLYSLNGTIYQASNTFSGLQSGIYNVFVKDIAGCGITTEKVVLLNYPRYFTPNNDGQGDYWHIKNAYLNQMSIKIFDRYGKLLAVLSQKDPGWDGNFNGHAEPSTDYWFVIEREGSNVYKGHFSLLR